MYTMLCLVLLILKAKANDSDNENSVIRLGSSSNETQNYAVYKDKPLKIIIKNLYHRQHTIWCTNYYYNYTTSPSYEPFIPATKWKTNDDIILNVKTVTAEMSTRWKCTVLEDYHVGTQYPYQNSSSTAVEFYFNLYVRDAIPVILTANKRKLKYVTTNLSVNYDGDANYTYEDGEEIDFSCDRADKVDSESYFEYYNAEGKLLFETQPLVIQTIKFRSVLRSKNNMYYLVCIRSTSSPYREYRYRTTFYMKNQDSHTDAVQHTIMMSVNGKKLTTFSNFYQSVDYVFRYIEGEVLNVTCQVNYTVQGTLRFYSDIKNVKEALRSPEMKIISLSLNTSNVYNKTVTCNISNTEIQKPTAKILFLPEVPDNGVRVRGLNTDNVLYQYTKTYDQWTIEYQYSVNDTLNLTCVFKNGFSTERKQSLRYQAEPSFKWLFEGESTSSPAFSTSTISNIHLSNKTFTRTLNPSHNGSKIRCIYYFENLYSNKSVEIILRLKPGPETDNDELILEKYETLYKIISGISVGVAIAILTLVCLACWRKRTKRLSRIQNAYDSLSNENDSPIPAFPNQWEVEYDDSHYTKIDEGVMQENYSYAVNNKVYRMPHNRQSNTSENHYSEIDEYLPKTDGLAQLSNKRDIQGAGSRSKNAIYNNICDLTQETYDNLRHDNTPHNKDQHLSTDYANVQKTGKKNKSVTFGPSFKQAKDTNCALKQKSDNYYANTDQENYMQPKDKRNRPNYENHFVKNQKTDNPLNLEYAEPYCDLEVNCKNDLYE